jgi:acetyl esterase/lipase
MILITRIGLSPLPSLGLCFTLLLALAPGQVRAADPSVSHQLEIKSVLDVAYYDGPGADRERHRLDVFYPGEAGKYPVVVLVHGGVWMFGDKDFHGQYREVGKFLARNGIVAVLPNYRLSPRVKHPEHAKDVARAFAWTIKNCAKYGGRPSEVFLAGHSAGGHLAALLATDDTFLKAEGLKRSDVRGVMSVSGVYRIPEINVNMPAAPGAKMTAGAGPSMGFTLNPLGSVFGADPKVRREASPLTHVQPGLPPFLIPYADHELPLLAGMAEEFAQALKAKKCEVEVRKISHRTHHNILFRATTPDDPVAAAMLDFIRKHAR